MQKCFKHFESSQEDGAFYVRNGHIVSFYAVVLPRSKDLGAASDSVEFQFSGHFSLAANCSRVECLFRCSLAFSVRYLVRAALAIIFNGSIGL